MNCSTIIYAILILIIIVLIFWIVYNLRKPSVMNVANIENYAQDNETGLYYFQNPRCPHCTNFEPIWDSIQIPNIIKHKINTADAIGEQMSNLYNITKIPTIMYIGKEGHTLYNGPNTRDAITAFAKEMSK